MTEIPSADEIRNALGVNETEDLTEFKAFTTEAIARFLNEHIVELQSHQSVLFRFPVLRDMGKYKRMWERHYDAFITVLREKGYWVMRDLDTKDEAVLRIELYYDDPTRLRRNGGQ